MKKKINVFDIELDAFSAKEAMKQIIQYLESETISLVEVVTLEMLMQRQNNPQWKEQMQKMDLVIPCEKEILEVSGICDKTVIKDLENKTLLKMFFKYLQKDKKKIFLLADQKEELGILRKMMTLYGRDVRIVGQAVLPEEGGRKDNVINEINGLEPDCIISNLPCPWQEAFITESYPLLNARVWFGCGPMIQKEMDQKTAGKLKHFFVKRFFCYLAGKQQNDE